MVVCLCSRTSLKNTADHRFFFFLTKEQKKWQYKGWTLYLWIVERFFFSIDRSIFWVLPSWRCCNSMKNLMTKLPWTMDENRYRERPVKRLFLILTLWVNNDLHSPVLHSAGKSTTKALSIDRKITVERRYDSLFFKLLTWQNEEYGGLYAGFDFVTNIDC